MVNAKAFSDQLGEMIAACFTTTNPIIRQSVGPTIDGSRRLVAACGADAEFVGERIKAVARALNGRIIKSASDRIVVTGSDGLRGYEIRFEIDRGVL